jgi:hypothetical protein
MKCEMERDLRRELKCEMERDLRSELKCEMECGCAVVSL